jgi:4-amino-4-deoxy-L-arabinose transferase-like glycosyltransferase
LAGLAFIPRLGLQNDEALFAAGIYLPEGTVYAVRVWGSTVPVMLMSYLGALKAWIYTPVFQIWTPGLWSIRVPMLLAATLAIWLFFRLVRRAAGARAAVIGCALLATDATFLLTATFDWGPVAVQHLLFIGAMLALLRFQQEPGHRRREWLLAGGFFLLGLGVWDKAIFLWRVVGLGAAALVVFPRELRSAFSRARVLRVVGAFCLGSAPLLLYNATQRLETFRANAAYSAQDLRGKANLLRVSLDGSSLFGWISPEDWEVQNRRAPGTALERASAWVREIAGERRRSLMPWALLVAVVLAPLARRDRAAWRSIQFAVVCAAVIWAQMAVTAGAGGATHHSVLVWPLPQFAIAAFIAGASRRVGSTGAAAAAILAAGLLSSNLLVVNEYYAQVVRTGGALNWTDAIHRLSDQVRHMPARQVFCVDWGIMDSLRLLNRGELPLRVGSDPVAKPQLDDADREEVRRWLAEPDSIYITHAEGNEFFAGVSSRLEALAVQSGYRRELLKVVPDSFGRPIFEVFRFVKTT